MTTRPLRNTVEIPTKYGRTVNSGFFFRNNENYLNRSNRTRVQQYGQEDVRFRLFCCRRGQTLNSAGLLVFLLYKRSLCLVILINLYKAWLLKNDTFNVTTFD